MWSFRKPYAELGQPINNVMVGAARPWKLRRLGCRVDAVEGAVYEWQIIGTDRKMTLAWLRRFPLLALHMPVVATRR